MFAVVRISGKQYVVAKGDVIEVDKIAGSEGDTIALSDVLLTGADGKVVVGTPTVKGVSATAKILAQFKGEKIEVRRYKSKVRYRKHRGFRPQLTKLEIVALA
jgi:large subunit ribosomal protein L21